MSQPCCLLKGFFEADEITSSGQYFYFLTKVICALCLLLLVNGRLGHADQLPACQGDLVDVGRLTYNAQSNIVSDVDGQEYTLAGLQFFNLTEFPAAERKKLEKAIGDILASFTNRPEIQAVKPRGQPDRYGRIAVHLYSNGKLRQWLQEELIRRGLALARPGVSGKNESACFARLNRDERTAETNHAGIWLDKKLVIMPSNDRNWATKANAYRIVEGTVLSVGETGSRYYLNFGENWQSDLTVIVAKRTAKRFKRRVGDIRSLAGKKLRIRGWMRSDRGPMIEVYHPDQIELNVD